MVVTTVNGSAPPGSWYHVVCVYQNKDMKIYLNGELKGTGYFNSNPTGVADKNMAIGVRSYSSIKESYFNGTIDDVRIYNKALMDTEIQQIYMLNLEKAYDPNPALDTTNISPYINLSWTPGSDAIWHDVYLGTDFNEVNDANTTTSGIYRDTVDVNLYDPEVLQRDTKYYWRIDEVNDSNICKGDVWNFTTSPVWKNDFNFPNDPFTSNVIFESDPRWVKFTIKLDDPCTVYYQNCKLYLFHYYFATEWLEPFIGMTTQEYDNVTLYDANQLAVMGAIILPPMTGIPRRRLFRNMEFSLFGFDPYTKEEIASMFNAVKNSVIADPCVKAVYFPTYEQQQVATANKAWFESQGIPVDSINRWIPGNICYSKGWAIGINKIFSGRPDTVGLY